nr:hypothetical protein [Tanacetum cinerariifolium]
MFAEEVDKIKKYVGGLPDMIYGSVVASKPKTMQEAIEIATELMDKKLSHFRRARDSKQKEIGEYIKNHSEPTTTVFMPRPRTMKYLVIVFYIYLAG